MYSFGRGIVVGVFFLYGFHVCKDLIFYGEGVGLLWWVSM